MRSPIATESACKRFKSGRLLIVLFTLDYGTYRETLACFPDVEIPNLTLPDGALDAEMAVKAIEKANKQGDQAREEIMTHVMWDNGPDVEGMVPWVEPA